MSTAWYRKCVPQMVRSSPSNTRKRLTVEVWDTSCVVTNMPAEFQVLINPANPQLSGVSQFVYFPVGGPQPPPSFEINKDTHPIMGYVSQWGGMEVGDGMMFAANVVDGFVHQLGGKELQRECQDALRSLGKETLSEGQAISTKAVGKLAKETPYSRIMHAVPPFFKHEHNTGIPDNITTEEVLATTYHSALDVAAEIGDSGNSKDDGILRVATPLLGAGCRGFPVDVAIDVAAKALLGSETAASNTNNNVPTTLAFAIPSGEIRQQLIEAFDLRQSSAQ